MMENEKRNVLLVAALDLSPNQEHSSDAMPENRSDNPTLRDYHPNKIRRNT